MLNQRVVFEPRHRGRCAGDITNKRQRGRDNKKAAKAAPRTDRGGRDFGDDLESVQVRAVECNGAAHRVIFREDQVENFDDIDRGLGCVRWHATADARLAKLRRS